MTTETNAPTLDPRGSSDYWDRLYAGQKDGGAPVVSFTVEPIRGLEALRSFRAQLAWQEPDGTRHIAATARGQLIDLQLETDQIVREFEQYAPSLDGVRDALLAEDHWLDYEPQVAIVVEEVEVVESLVDAGLAPLLLSEIVRTVTFLQTDVIALMQDGEDEQPRPAGSPQRWSPADADGPARVGLHEAGHSTPTVWWAHAFAMPVHYDDFAAPEWLL